MEEAVRSGLKLETLILSDKEAKDLPKEIRSAAKREFTASPQVLQAMTDLETSPGILAVASRPQAEWKDLLKGKPAPLVVLDGLQDPGNAATIARTAEAAGAVGLITTPGTARLYSPKALRGAMGSTLRLPCLEHQKIADIARELKAAGYGLLGTQGVEFRPYTEIDWKAPWALILGQEGQGLSAEWEPLLTDLVSIPMKPPVESLNVAAAAAVLLFESARHR